MIELSVEQKQKARAVAAEALEVLEKVDRALQTLGWARCQTAPYGEAAYWRRQMEKCRKQLANIRWYLS